MFMKCEITFHDIVSNAIFSGQILRGTVVFGLDKEYEFRDVYVNVHGRTKIEIRHGKSNNRFSKSHIDEKVSLIKKNSANDKITLTPGNHEYDFELLLPSTLPSTFNGSCGYTEYQATLVLDSSFLSKEKFSKEFVVIKPLDLNETPSLGLPVTIEKNTFVGFYLISCCYSCCVSKPIEIKLKTSKTGFTPKQVMDLEIFVNNNSNRKIQKFLVRLIKAALGDHIYCLLQHLFDEKTNVEYTIQNKIFCCFPDTKIDSNALMQYETRGCDQHTEENIELVVGFPPTEPTDVTRKNIKITYSIEVVGVTGWQYGNISMNVPITMGSKNLIPKD